MINFFVFPIPDPSICLPCVLSLVFWLIFHPPPNLPTRLICSPHSFPVFRPPSLPYPLVLALPVLLCQPFTASWFLCLCMAFWPFLLDCLFVGPSQFRDLFVLSLTCSYCCQFAFEKHHARVKTSGQYFLQRMRNVGQVRP